MEACCRCSCRCLDGSDDDADDAGDESAPTGLLAITLTGFGNLRLGSFTCTCCPLLKRSAAKSVNTRTLTSPIRPCAPTTLPTCAKPNVVGSYGSMSDSSGNSLDRFFFFRLPSPFFARFCLGASLPPPPAGPSAGSPMGTPTLLRLLPFFAPVLAAACPEACSSSQRASSSAAKAASAASSSSASYPSSSPSSYSLLLS
mmetsp:Transcript_41742/g.84338  ORF Transcript_41742/g.84338 Transcript_41742/m.84338 type:complete len:200 (-) Transcript_41742:496-1095(-)